MPLQIPQMSPLQRPLNSFPNLFRRSQPPPPHSTDSSSAPSAPSDDAAAATETSTATAPAKTTWSSASSMEQKRILAVSSHVVHGYVGNRASTLPLQLLDWDVDVLNTVTFSNHTGYTQWRGERMTAAQVREIYEGLKMNTLTDYNVVLTGYIPGAQAVLEVGAVVDELKSDNAAVAGRAPLIWVLDPVMGDEEKLYVAPDVIPAYESLLSKATVITPNQFEAELLSHTKFETEADIFTGLAILYDKFKTPNIIISSAVFAGDTKREEFVCAGQTIRADGSPCQFFLRLPFIEAYFTGTGDLFASLVADRYYHYLTAAAAASSSDTPTLDAELPLVRTVEDVSAIVQAVLRNTAESVRRYNAAADETAAATGVPRPEPGTKERRIMDMKHGELRLIHSQHHIRSPRVNIKAQFYTRS
ncbi:Ribokinase-like protein [Limtongia smithiae]|uniref:Ribokinase-like protein n=1 Tax=Limtongia smithiae TaxID=1125753 RepID=UPI0034CF9672